MSDFEEEKLFKEPKTKREIRKLVDYCNWYRPYVKNINPHLEKINDKLKESTITWDESDRNNIRTIIELSRKNMTLYQPDLNATVAVHIVRPKFYQFLTSAKSVNLLCFFIVENRKIVATKQKRFK